MAMSRSTWRSPRSNGRSGLFLQPDPRLKITHRTLINDDLLRWIKAAGVILALLTSYGYYNS